VTAARFRAVVHGATVAGLLFAAYLFLVSAPRVGTFGYDAWSYWSVSLPHPYTIPLGALGSFPYPPPIALLFSLFKLVPWPVFVVLWTCLGIATVTWLGGRWALALFAFPPVALELYHGNIHLLIAAAVAIGFRHPVAWAFPLLAKPTVGVGLLWFVARREWRPLATAVGVSSAAVLVSLVVAPSLWGEWVAYAAANINGTPGGPTVGLPLWLRLTLAAVIVVWGARTDRRWTVAVGATLALPVLWFAGLSVLIAAVPSLRDDRRPVPAGAGAPTSRALPAAVGP
jgi:hypothetical protein